MKAFLVTFKPVSESPDRGMRIEAIQAMAERTRARKRVVEPWRFRNRSEVSIGDRVFLLQQGKMGPAIIGYGSVAGAPRQNKRGTWLADIDFDSVVDPETQVLASKAELRRMREALSLWKTQASGVKVPTSVAHDLEALVFRNGRNIWRGPDRSVR